MKRINVAALKARLSENLRAVEGGDELVVTDRGRPIARLVPFEEEHAFRLPTRPPRRPGGFSGLKIAPAEVAIDPVEALLEERRERSR